MRAAIAHLELPAADPERAAAFYRRAFGWRVEPVVWEGPAYFTIRPDPTPAPAAGAAHSVSGGGIGAGIGGGIGAPETVGSDRPLPVLHVTGGSLEDCLERIVAAGGRIEEEPRAVGTGRFARFRDSEDNLMALWEKGEAAASGS